MIPDRSATATAAAFRIATVSTVTAPGRLITIEGVDGAGKTTLSHGLLGALREKGIDAELLREPGGVKDNRPD